MKRKHESNTVALEESFKQLERGDTVTKTIEEAVDLIMSVVGELRGLVTEKQ